MAKLLAWLDDNAAVEVDLVGGKAGSLHRLNKAGFNVPGGFVVTTEAFEQMAKELEESVLASFDELGTSLVAIRSSAVAEDGANAAWAGQFDTFLNVERDHLIESIKKCWESVKSDRAKAYAKNKGLESGAVAVIVQQMIQSQKAGVAFSVHPVTQNHGHVVIEAVYGLGDQLVSGLKTPDTYVIDKKGKKAIETSLSSQKPILNKAEIAQITDQIVKIEKMSGSPVDIEWLIADDKLYIMQSRPITTLG